jgi:hypothetical protein
MRKPLIPAYLPQSEGSSEVMRRKRRSPIMKRRLREERLTREAAAGSMLFPARELADNTPIDHVRFRCRIRNALNAAGRKAIGEVRETSADALLSFSAGASESSGEIDSPLRIFVLYERGLLAARETTDALICVATTPRPICS